MLHKHSFLTHAPSLSDDLSCSGSSLVPLDGTHVLWEGKKMLHFCAQDALGLSLHADIKKKAMLMLLQDAVGSPRFSLFHRTLACQQELQDKFADLLGVQTAQLFSSRSAALCVLLSSITRAQSQVFVDEGNAPALHEIVHRLQADVVTYRHLDLAHLRDLLAAAPDSETSSRVIFTESLFGLEGDVAELKMLSSLAEQFHAFLIVDDSHSFGLKGPQGMGLAAQQAGIDCILGSFEESCGIPGAYLGCSRDCSDYLVQTCRSWNEWGITLPQLGALDAALEWVLQMEGERRQLEHRSHWLRQQLRTLEIPLGHSSAHLLPLTLQSEEDARGLWESLIEQEILCDLIPSLARVRIAVNALHTLEDLHSLIQALQTCLKGLVVCLKRSGY